MTDDRVATRITVDRGAGELAMQEWFVRERCEPPVVGVHFAGADDAAPAPGRARGDRRRRHRAGLPERTR